jgi:DNA-binding beta-propeller fold protein YncE
MRAWHVLRLMRRIVLALLGLLLLAGAARAGGGSIRAFVLLPSEGRLAIVDVESGQLARMVIVPRGAGPVAASVDGSRVLVANTRRGVVIEIDGRTGRRLHLFGGLGRPVDMTLVPRAEFGLVRPRYAVVADAQGWVDFLDLEQGRVVRRVSVSHPVALVLSDPQVWVASAGSRVLTQLDVSDVPEARVVAHPNAGIVPAALAPDPGGLAVDVVSRDGRLISIQAVSLARRLIGRISGVTSQLRTGYQGIVWAAQTDGRVLGIRASNGRVVAVMHTPAASRVAIVGGWLAAAHDRSIRMLVLGSNRRGTTFALPGTVGAFSFAES